MYIATGQGNFFKKANQFYFLFLSINLFHIKTDAIMRLNEMIVGKIVFRDYLKQR